MSAAAFPTWVLLEPFVFRRDDSSSSSSFPDETTAPIRATGTTTWGATFRIAFSVADPPRISRLYAQLPSPGFLGREANPLAVVDPPPPRPVSREEDEFVVAELTLFKPIDRSRVFADICLLHSTSDAAADQQLTWKSMRVELFLSTNNNRSAGDSDLQQIRWWYTDAVIPFDKWLCWVDYHRGILLCDMSKLPNHPTVSFIWFPLDKLPISGNRNGTSTCCYRAVSVVDRGRALKFVNITRQDGVPFAALKPGTGFTITCHTLVVVGSKFGFVNKKMWVVSIDMSTKTVESSSLYINGNEGLQTDDADLIRCRSMSALPFIPCEFPEFLNSSRERKDIE
nr:unnamed protein product [Digitaria exilis]